MRCLFACVLLMSSCFSVLANTLISVDDAQVRKPMPGRGVTAAFLTLTNNSEQELTLIAASSSAFARVEIHHHTHRDGVMRMEQIEQLAIAPKEQVVFQPGGKHLMLFTPNEVLELGKNISVKLEFNNGQTLDVLMPIVATPKR